MKLKIFISLLFCTLQTQVFSQISDTTDFTNMSLEELLNIKVEVVSKVSQPYRETPGIITVISQDDIKKSGARDLTEILQLLAPGFEFGVDVEGVVGIGMRGVWGHEGKILLLIDGMECNEDVFSCTAFGNHYLTENIQKIEIIRGPGSSVYGGYAGVGVINVITKKADLNGGYVGTLYSQMSKTYSHRNVNWGYGNSQNKLKFKILGFYSQGNRSQDDNIDYAGNSVNLSKNSNIESFNLNGAIQFNGLDIHLNSDLYSFDQIDLWGINRSDGKLKEKFNTMNAAIKYDLKLSEKFKIVPSFQYKFQQPWNVDVPEESYMCSKEVNKYFASATSFWDITGNTNLVAGFEYVGTKLSLGNEAKDYEETFKNGASSKSYNNVAGFLQFMYLGRIVNLTIGGRYDNSSVYGTSFVPRIGLTKSFDKFHVKAMYSQSFRVPGGIIPERVPAGQPSVEPEKASNYELETGIKLGNSYLTISAFDIIFYKIIVYVKDDITQTGTYKNSGSSNTAGIEADYKFKSENFAFSFNYAYYYAVNHDIENYKVSTDEHLYLGFANHKCNILLSYKFFDQFYFSLTSSFLGKRYAYSYFDEATQTDVLTKYDPSVILGANISADRIYKGLGVALGVSNLTNEKQLYLQPYKGSHAPLPGLSRSVWIQLNYAF